MHRDIKTKPHKERTDSVKPADKNGVKLLKSATN